MTGIYMSYVCTSLSSTLGGLPGLPGALCSCTPALWPLADLLCFGNRESGNTRLGQSKVPQPGVGLIHMAASDLFMIYLFYLWLNIFNGPSPPRGTQQQPTPRGRRLWLTYANHVHFYNLWFTYGLLMIYLYFTYVLLMIYLLLTYDLLILLMTYLCKSCFLFFTFNLLMIYICFTYVLLIIDSWWQIFLWFTWNILLIYLCLINSLNYDLLLMNLIYLWLTDNHINDICFTNDLLISHFD